LNLFKAVVVTGLAGFTRGASDFRLIALALLATSTVSATGQDIFGKPTNLSSISHGMISDRFQKHSWWTSDGYLHVLIRDPQTGPALKLYRAQAPTISSFGLEYQFRDSGEDSTSDGVLIDDHLYVVYNTTAGAIEFVELEYLPESYTWVLRRSNTVAQNSNGFTNDRPTLAVESDGTIWVGCVLESARCVDSFMVYISEDGGQSWTISHAKIPPPKSTVERSLRLADGPGVVYALYSDRGAFGLSLKTTATWDHQGVFFKRSTPAWNGMIDPHGSHFSTVVDADGNLHFLSNDGDFRGVYMRYNLRNASWSRPIFFDSLNSKMRAAYMEIATDKKGQLLAVFSATNGQRNCLITFKSRDNGDTWWEGGVLMPLRLDTRNARPEMPERLRASQSILQQVSLEGGRLQSVVSYIVPWSLDPPSPEKLSGLP
jgi:hypothetical protein